MTTFILPLLQQRGALAITADAGFHSNDFLTLGTLGTLAGSSAAVYIVCGTLQSVFNWNPKWLALLLSILISVVVALATSSELTAWIKYTIAVINGFLIFATATGANVMRAAAVNDPSGGGAGTANVQPTLNTTRTFSTSWF